MLLYLDKNPLAYQEIARWTRRDTIFKQIFLYIQHRRSDKCPDLEKWRPHFTMNHKHRKLYIVGQEDCRTPARTETIPRRTPWWTHRNG